MWEKEYRWAEKQLEGINQAAAQPHESSLFEFHLNNIITCGKEALPELT